MKVSQQGELENTGTIALIEDGTPPGTSPPCLTLFLLATISCNIQEVAARGAKVLTIAEENVAKEGDLLFLITFTLYEGARKTNQDCCA